MIKIVGTRRKEGSFEKDGKIIKYDNTILYFITDENNDVDGYEAGQMQFKTDLFMKIAGGVSAYSLIDKIVTIESSIINGKPLITRLS